MKVLVTGGAGFIASNFMYYMVDKYPEYDFVNLDALTYAGNYNNVKPLEGKKNYKFVKGDITDREFIDKLFEEEKFDWVVNFAAESHVDNSIKNPGVFLTTNILGTQVLMDASRKYGVKRYHQVSTDEVYGDLPLDRPDLLFTEQTPLHTSSPYSSSKAGADLLVGAYHRTYGLPITISRCSNNYGPYQFPEKLIPVVISKALNDEPIPVYGKGENVRDWIHVIDHNIGVDMILHKGKVGEVYNLGGHSERTNLDVVKTILKQLGKPESLITYVTDRPGHDLRYAIDSSKAEKELGWDRTYTFETGIKETIDWYLNNQDWIEEIKNGNYKESYNGVDEEKYVDFQVLYQGEWNFVTVTNPAGKHQIANFAGGNELTLELEFTFNDGAASQPDLFEKGEKEGEGLSSIGYGKLNLGDVVTTETLVKNINIKTISGQSYNAGVHTKVDGNRVELRFLERLGKGIYVLQFTSDNYAFDTVNGRILGQFIIDNSGMKGGVNLSQIWVILMIFGGLLALGASSAYLVPLLIIKVNEARVDKENERIARMKNPEAYATKQKKSLKDVFAKIIYNIKTPAYERKKQAEKEQEEKKPVEEKVYSNRFTEMLRERQEKRDFMRENNITSAEMEKIKEAKAALEQDELNSFSVLRDDEDEIATFHAAEDEISTLETGAYVENGTRFAKLDSLNDDGSSGDGESN